MRSLIVAIATLAGLGFAHAATAASTDARQCPAPWADTAQPAICRDTPQPAKVLAGYEPTLDQPHVMTRAEIRAELNSIKAPRAETAEPDNALIASVQPK